jgi:hypothetical protein
MLSTSRLPALCSVFLLLHVTTTTQASLFSPLLSVLDWSASNETSIHRELRFKRAEINPTSCPTGYKNCANIGAPGLCCANSAVCSPDQAGHVACCPSGAACTGSISSIITGGVVAAGGSAVSTTTTAAASQPLTASGSSSPSTATSGNGLIVASGHGSPTTTAAATDSTEGGFVLVGTSTAATLGSSGMRNVQTVSRLLYPWAKENAD